MGDGELPGLMVKRAENVELVPLPREARNLPAPGRPAIQMREYCRTTLKDQSGLVVGEEQFDEGSQFAPGISTKEPFRTRHI